MYAFSTENWKRPEEEVGGIMKLLDKYLHEAIRDMRKKNIRMKVFGDVSRLSPQLQQLIAETDEISKDIEGLSGEYLHKLRRQSGDSARRTGLCRGLRRRKVTDSLTEDMFSNYMYSAGIQTRIFSFARAESTGFQTFCSGSAHTQVLLYRHPVAGFHSAGIG